MKPFRFYGIQGQSWGIDHAWTSSWRLGVCDSTSWRHGGRLVEMSRSWSQGLSVSIMANGTLGSRHRERMELV